MLQVERKEVEVKKERAKAKALQVISSSADDFNATYQILKSKLNRVENITGEERDTLIGGESYHNFILHYGFKMLYPFQD